MEFTHFINNIANLKKEKLLATDAHIKMAPLERISYLKDKSYSEIEPKNAAKYKFIYLNKGFEKGVIKYKITFSNTLRAL